MSDKTANRIVISFVIPAYNAVDTVVRCLDSIYNLPLKPTEFEVIFVDDCSTDSTFEVVAGYQSKYANLTLLEQPKNNRQGAARNRGVSVAKGDYICFVDADDAVTEGVVAAIRLAKEKQTDMTAYHYAFVNESGDITKAAANLSFPEEQIFSGIELQNKHPYWCSGPVAYIYNRKFLKKVNYPFCEDVLFEDSDFVAVHLYYAKHMAYSQKLGYLAYYREGSTTRSNDFKNVADYLLLGTRMMAFYERIMNERVDVVMNEGEKKFAEGVLEGACYNVERSCRRLLKLGSLKELRAYYDRLDAHVKREDLCKEERLKKYYWNAWTASCLGHKNVAIAIFICVSPLYRILTRINK